MSGAYYCIWIVVILLLIRWFLENDGRELTTGLFALRFQGELPEEDSQETSVLLQSGNDHREASHDAWQPGDGR
jgi:hypothetical protein